MRTKSRLRRYNSSNRHQPVEIPFQSARFDMEALRQRLDNTGLWVYYDENGLDLDEMNAETPRAKNVVFLSRQEEVV